jgi:hypothetical protein
LIIKNEEKKYSEKITIEEDLISSVLTDFGNLLILLS